MKILLVNKFHYLKGGSEKYYFELAELLKKYGHEVAFFSMEDDKNIKTEEKEYFVKSIDLNTGKILRALDVIYSRKNERIMEEALDEFNPDIVHLNNFQRHLSSSIINPIKKRNIPLVFTAHDMNAICPASAMLYKNEICEDCIKKGYKSCINKKCIKESKLKSILATIEAKYYRRNEVYKKIDCIISPSEFLKNKLIEGNLKYNKIEVLHNFVINSFTSEKEDKGYAFYFGRLSSEKGIMNLIKAINNLKKGKLLVAGTGSEQGTIENYLKDNNLEDRIKLLGYLKQDEIKDYIKKSRFVVVPSIWYENCPYSILETMEIGKPIIASKIGGIPELVQDNKNGFLYQYNSIEQLTEKINVLFQNKELAEKQGLSSRKLFEESYNEGIYYDRLIKIYENLIGEKNAK